MSPPGAAGPHLQRCGSPDSAGPGPRPPRPWRGSSGGRRGRSRYRRWPITPGERGTTGRPNSRPTSVQLAAGGTAAGTGEPAARESSREQPPEHLPVGAEDSTLGGVVLQQRLEPIERLPGVTAPGRPRRRCPGCEPGGRRSVGSAATGWTARAVSAGRPVRPPGRRPARARGGSARATPRRPATRRAAARRHVAAAHGAAARRRASGADGTTAAGASGDPPRPVRSSGPPPPAADGRGRFRNSASWGRP